MRKTKSLPPTSKPLLNPSFFLLSVFIALSAALLLLVFSPERASAQIPPPYVSCDDTDSPEFQSTRPYQKSPCNTEISETALFCGNRLVLSDEVSTIQTASPVVAPNCTKTGDTTYRCSYEIQRAKNIRIGLSDANFPILGNSELVANSQDQTDTLNNAERMNEYVNWYLSGVTGKAEYEPTDDPDIIVNYSGPIKKLLPWSTQNDLRAQTVRNAGSTQHNQVVGCVNLLGQITPCYPQRLGVREVRLSSWTNNTPPKESDYDDFKSFWVAYRRWRGDSCVAIFGASLCFDNPLKPNYPGNLYSNVPFSSNEDRVGLVSIDSTRVTPASKDVVVKNVTVNSVPAELYFAHTEEAEQLAEILQSTFVPSGITSSGTQVSAVSPTDECSLVNIRSNEGDDLFAGEIGGSVNYTAEFFCDFDVNLKSYDGSCKKTVAVGLSVVSETPNADSIWSKLVAGNAGIFKRIFPKIGQGGAILGLLDIPAATKVTYSGDGLVSASNPDVRSGQSAELYFPHIGGVSEYFLKGIQTILRPKGFGEQIISGAEGTFGDSGDINCDITAPDVSVPRLISKQDYFQLALNWVSGQTGNHALECYNDTVRRSRQAGINTALTLWVWMNESNASNYSLNFMKDFGADYPAPEGYVDQINEFFARAKRYTRNSPLCAGRNVTDLQAFAYIYLNGVCDPNAANPASGETGREYYEKMERWITRVISSCPMPSSPMDTSCP